MEIFLREPQPGDIGWLISTHGIMYSQQFHFDLRFEIDIAKKVSSSYEQSNDFNILIIAHIDSERVGSIAVSLQFEKSAFINFLCVRNAYRRRGVAKKMFENVIKRSRDYGLELLRLETYSCLVGAREMYKNYGFKMYQSNKDIEKYSRVFDQEFWEMRL